MNKAIATILIATVSIFSICSSAGAYTTIGKWGGNSTRMRAAAVSFPAGAWRNSLSTVASRFNQNPSNWYFNQTWNDGSVGFNNGQNEVWFSSSSAHSPAVCYTWYYWWNPNRIKEADVVFYNGISYTTSMNKTTLWSYGGSRRPFQTTAMHEYGHAAGLGHENDEYNIMGEDWTHIHLNGSTARSYVGEDGASGLVALYGRWSGYNCQDVAVTHWRYWYADGAYSRHRLCRMFYSGGGTLPSNAYQGQRRYRVSKGQTVKVEFTYENLGETSKTVRVGYYLSTNNYISTGDRFLGYGVVNISRGNVDTTSNTWITIPSNLNSGQTYYLGAFIDYNNAVAEIDSSNNRAYHIIRIN